GTDKPEPGNSDDERVVMTLGQSADTTVFSLLYGQALRQPDAIAILAPGRQALTYIDLWRQIQHIADVLQARGVTPSTRVAIVLPNGPEMAATFLGVAACAVCAPLNPAYQAAELRFYLQDIGAQFVIIAKDECGPVRSVAQELGIGVIEIAADATLSAGQFRIGSEPFDHSEPRSLSQSHDIALILHTSGTTARPKIVPLSHVNLVISARSIANHLVLRPDDRCLNVMPLFHIHGLVGALLASITAGSSIVCTPGFDDPVFFDWVAHYDPTWYTAVPTIHQSVVAQGVRYRQIAPHHRFRFVRSSSAALPPKTFRSLQALTGAPVVEAYGMTEASHEMASNPLSGSQKSGSVGVPTGVEIALMDESGQLLAAGATGEIVIRGPGVTAGYENNPDANAKAFCDGWFRTGDQGWFDDDGYLHIAGRLKEVVNRGGEKVWPREVDDALLGHPAVLQAVAFAVPHPTLGEDVAAAVVLREGANVDESGLRRFLFARLAHFKIPSRIVFVDAVPKGSTGKIQRNSLYEKLGHLFKKDCVAPRRDVERSLVAIFREILACGPVGVDDNFFSLGGDSLNGARVMARINDQQGIALPVPTLFSHPTIKALAVKVEEVKARSNDVDKALEWEIAQMSDEEVARELAKSDDAAL
ncbi:MAG: AMP-binding protein, partial [Porticoccaceae bacterium]